MTRESTRRRLLLAGASISAVVLAGCLGDDDGETDDGASDDGDGGDPDDSVDDGDPDDSVDDGDPDDTVDDGGSDDLGDGQGFPLEGDFELPTDPDAGDFYDATGADVVVVETVQRDHDPQFVFDPPFVRVDQGAIVRWVNADGVFHTVTSSDSLENRTGGDVFDATISSEGDEFEWEPEETGIQHYYCSPHAGFMYGSVAVV